MDSDSFKVPSASETISFEKYAQKSTSRNNLEDEMIEDEAHHDEADFKKDNELEEDGSENSLTHLRKSNVKPEAVNQSFEQEKDEVELNNEAKKKVNCIKSLKWVNLRK